MSRTWHNAHNDMDAELSQALGLAEVLNEVAADYPGLCNPNPMANGILSLIKSIRGSLDQIDKLHREEWSLQHQSQQATPAPMS